MKKGFSIGFPKSSIFAVLFFGFVISGLSCTPADDLAKGIYVYTIHHEGSQYLNYINFYENGIYYYSKYNDGQTYVGYYKIEEMKFKIKSTSPKSGDEAKESRVKCNYKITFYELDGTTVFGEAGYNDENIIGVTMQDFHDFVPDLTSGHTPEDEKGVTLVEYYVSGDDYSLVSIRHNGTFDDTVGAYIDGSWEKNGDTYTLIDSMTNETYLLKENGDGTAEYTEPDGTSQILVSKN